jgi:hypothetical protein
MLRPELLRAIVGLCRGYGMTPHQIDRVLIDLVS